MTRRHLQTALIGKLRVAVPCSASDTASIQAAHDAIRALTDNLPLGSSVEWIGSPDFGKVEVVAKEPTLTASGDGSPVVVNWEGMTNGGGAGHGSVYRTEVTAEQAAVPGTLTVEPGIPSWPSPYGESPGEAAVKAIRDIPESLRRVPRH